MLRRTGEHAVAKTDTIESRTIDTGDTRTDAATAFDKCLIRAQESPDVSFGEAEIRNFPGYDRILRKIIKRAPDNHATLIAIKPMSGSDIAERHVFILRRSNKNDASITTFFDIEHRGNHVEGVEAFQEVDGEGVHLERIIGLDSDGLPQIVRVDGDERSKPTRSRKVWQTDLESIVGAIDGPIPEVIKSTTEEFQVVSSIDPSLKQRLSGAAFGFRHPEKLAA